MNKKSLFRKINTFIAFSFVLILIVLVYKTSDILLSNSLNDYLKLNKKTSNYISFNYAGGDINSLYEINSPKIYSDFKGKRFVNEYYDFEINVPKEQNDSIKVNYDILLKDLGSDLEDKFIKVYLTDSNNTPLEGFNNTVPVYSAFLNDSDGKIIYSGILDDDNKKFRLRIWISDIYNKKYNNNLAFQIRVKMK
ncbi:MAG: hypothetical protein J6C28_07445 [Bacilli bacterium]|nr:hypothetical protein [Bacilli bacterium]